MMKVRHIQSKEEREVSRYEWERPDSEYQRLKRFWEILNEGDSVELFFVHENGKEGTLGLYDRDHAERMIKKNSRQFFYHEIDKRSPESILIDQALAEARDKRIIILYEEMDEKFYRAVEKAKRQQLLQEAGKNVYELSEEGEKALELGGYDNWKKAKEETEKPQPSIHISGGNAVIGNNNTGNTQGRDIITNQHPTEVKADNDQKRANQIAIWAIIVGALTTIGVAVWQQQKDKEKAEPAPSSQTSRQPNQTLKSEVEKAKKEPVSVKPPLDSIVKK